MDSDCTDAVTMFLKAYCKDTYKAINYTSTFRYEFLKNQVVPAFENWLMFMYCAEDREAMDTAWDTLAKQEEEYKLEQTEGSLTAKIIPIKRGFFKDKGNVDTSNGNI